MPAGFAAIGTIGLFSGMAGAIGTIATGVIVSAVVGAAIGGISAAVMGGDIGKGMLFGAIGGVVTGGIAGEGIAGMFTGAETIGTTAAGEIAKAPVGSSMIEPGTGFIAESGIVEGATTTVPTPAGPTTGSWVKDIAVASAPEVIKGIGQGILAGQKEQPKAKSVSAPRGGGGGGGGGGLGLDEQLAIQAAKDKAAMERLLAEGKIGSEQIELKSDMALKEMGEEYKLAKDKSAFEHEQAWDKQKATAAAAARAGYQSGAGAYEAVLAAQEGRGDPGTGRENTAQQPPMEQALAGEEAVA